MPMQWIEIEQKAKTLKIKHPERYSLSDLIKTIQRTEGNFDCFSTALQGYCGQKGCAWRELCLKE